jgi:hypothetical protein
MKIDMANRPRVKAAYRRLQDGPRVGFATCSSRIALTRRQVWCEEPQADHNTANGFGKSIGREGLVSARPSMTAAETPIKAGGASNFAAI